MPKNHNIVTVTNHTAYCRQKCSILTYMLEPGPFDILFPSIFGLGLRLVILDVILNLENNVETFGGSFMASLPLTLVSCLC